MGEQVNHVHTQMPGPLRIGLKLTRSTQGVSLEADVDYVAPVGQSADEAVIEAGRLMSLAYQTGEVRALELGLTIGKEQRS